MRPTTYTKQKIKTRENANAKEKDYEHAKRFSPVTPNPVAVMSMMMMMIMMIMVGISHRPQHNESYCSGGRRRKCTTSVASERNPTHAGRRRCRGRREIYFPRYRHWKPVHKCSRSPVGRFSTRSHTHTYPIHEARGCSGCFIQDSARCIWRVRSL